MKKTKKPQTPPTSKKKRPKVRIDKPYDVKRLLNKEINALLIDETTTDKLRAITYAAQTILKVFEIVLMEERLGRIEKRLGV